VDNFIILHIWKVHRIFYFSSTFDVWFSFRPCICEFAEFLLHVGVKSIKVQNMKFPHLLSPFMSNSNSYIKVNILRNSNSHSNRLTIDTPHAKTENIIFAHWGLSRNGRTCDVHCTSLRNNVNRKPLLKMITPDDTIILYNFSISDKMTHVYHWLVQARTEKVYTERICITFATQTSSTPVSSTNKSEWHDIAKIVVQVALSTITPTPNDSLYLTC
jgi:hypothetical protein